MLAPDYPLTVVCRVLELPRSTLYYQPVVRDEAELRLALEAAAQEFPTYGSRRLTQQVRRTPYRMSAGRKRVRRLMDELGLKRRPKPRICRTTNSQHGFGRFPNLVAEKVASAPEEIWGSELLFKLWKSHGRVDEWRTTKPERILCEVYAKLLALVCQHWLIAACGWSDPERSLFKAAQVIRSSVVELAGALASTAHLVTVLRAIERVLKRFARLNKRRASPATAQQLSALTTSFAQA